MSKKITKYEFYKSGNYLVQIKAVENLDKLDTILGLHYLNLLKIIGTFFFYSCILQVLSVSGHYFRRVHYYTVLLLYFITSSRDKISHFYKGYHMSQLKEILKMRDLYYLYFIRKIK